MHTQLLATQQADDETYGTLRIDPRLNGPRRSANGGFAAGTIASWIDAKTVTVVLRRPVPLAVDLEVRPDLSDGVVLLHRGATIADAHPGELSDAERPPAPSFIDALRAREAHPLRGIRHQFSDCYVCGPGRPDGMHVTPGPVPDRPHLLAAPWIVGEHETSGGFARMPAVWAALDCPSYPADAMDRGEFCVLGTMTARVDRRPRVAEPVEIYSWTRERSQRRYETSAVMVDERGDVMARADSTWIVLRHQRLVTLLGRLG